MKVDTNCYVGHWPFRRIAYRTFEDMSQLMARAGVQHALLTPMAGIFYKDSLSAVRELHGELAANRSADVSLVGVVNPAFPGWREDLSMMTDDLGCVAVRLFPNYHHYRLMDRDAGELLDTLQTRNVPLILSPRVEDERLHHWLVKVPAVSRLDLRWLLRAFPELNVVLCDLKPDEVDFLQREIVTHRYASVDTSARMPQFYLEEMVGQLGAARVIFGTGAPLNYPECTLQLIADAQLTEADKRRILFENATRMFDIQVEAA